MVLANTRATLHHLKMTARRVAISFTVLSQFLYAGYLIYALCTGRGKVWINALLLALSVGYLVFFTVTEWRLSYMNDKERRAERKKSRRVGQTYRWVKLAAKTLNLGIVVYGVCSGAENATSVSMALTTLMIIFWVIEALFAVGSAVIDYIVTVLIEALEEDRRAAVDTVTAPVKSAVNRVKRFLGRDTIEKEPHKRPRKFDLWEEELKEYAKKK